MLGTEKDQILPPQLPKFFPGYKSLRNEAEDGCNDSIDTSRTDKEDYVDYLKATNKKNSYDEYKEDNLQHQYSNESVINKTK